MKKLLIVISAVFALNAADVLTGDTKLACEAIICLSSPTTPPSECTPSIRKYFSITHEKAWKQLEARKNFLKLCPTGDASATANKVAEANNGGIRYTITDCEEFYNSKYKSVIVGYKKVEVPCNSENSWGKCYEQKPIFEYQAITNQNEACSQSSTNKFASYQNRQCKEYVRQCKFNEYENSCGSKNFKSIKDLQKAGCFTHKD